MDFNYEFLVFQHGNHDAKEKLEYYPNFIMILLGELKALREAMCASCHQKCPSSRAPGNQLSLAASDDSKRPLKRRHVEDDSPTLHEMDVFGRSITPAPSSSYMPVDTTIASVSSSLVEISTDRRDELDNPIFYAERDVSADPTIDVTFFHSFHHNISVRSVCFSYDGRYVAVSTYDASIFIYEVESHMKYCELREYASQYGTYTRPLSWNLCFSPNGRYLCVLDNAERIIIWDIPNKRMRNMFQWNDWLAEIRFSPDGRFVALAVDPGLVLFSMRDNSRRMVSEGSRFDFHPGGRGIATGNNGILVILDVRTGKTVKRWNGHGIDLRRVKFTPDGRGLFCAYEDMIEKWDVSDAVPVLIRKLDFHDSVIRPSISPEHRLLAYSNELWDVNSGNRICILQGHNNGIFSVDFSPAGTYLAIGSRDGFASLWKCSSVYPL